VSSTAPAIPLWPDWTGETVVCIATGPSLTRAQLDAVKVAPVRSIGINDIGLTEDWIDVWYGADGAFWKHYWPQAAASKALTVCADRNAPGVTQLYLEVVKSKDRWPAPGFALNGGHSGFQALTLAISLGASRVVLIGYDCKAKGALTNYFGSKSASLHKPSPYDQWPKCYRDLVLPEGVEVLNATSSSAIDAFPMVDLEDELWNH
jgi:hypothetical protein